MEQNNKSARLFERKVIEWITQFIRSDANWLGYLPLQGLRFAWRHKPGPIENRPEPSLVPAGLFIEKRGNQAGDLLVSLPWWIDRFLIGDLTGGYGYSHNSIDTGEVDLPTGKPIMIEVTLGQTVARKFLDNTKNVPTRESPFLESELTEKLLSTASKPC